MERETGKEKNLPTRSESLKRAFNIDIEDQRASCISANTASTSVTLSLRKSGLLTVAIPTSISLALKSLLTTACRTLIATSIASFSFQLPSFFLNCFSS